MRPLRFLATLLALALTAWPSGVSAHPHVWIEASASLVVEAGRVEALRITWVFDDLYSHSVGLDFDANGDGRLDEAELAELAEISRQNLANYSFFTHLRIEGERRQVERVEDFRATVEKERIVYRFTVPIAPAVPLEGQAFAFSLFDETYFVDLALDEGAVATAGEGTDDCRKQRWTDQGQPLYFGLFFPTYVSVSCSG